MKKILTLALAVAATGCAFAYGPKKVAPRSDKFKYIPFELAAPQKIATRADEGELSVDFTLADEVYSATGLQDLPNGMEVYQAFCMSEENAKTFAGDKVTSINITTGAVVKNNNVYDNDLTEVTVFISEDLNSAPVYTQAGTLGKEILTEYKVDLDTPYEIQEGKSFYVGYYFTLANQDLYYIAYDGIENADENSCLIGVKQNEAVQWMRFNDQIGALCIGCTIVGENMPQNGMVLDDIAGPLYTEPGEGFEYMFLVKNIGYSAESIELSCQIGDSEPVVKTYTFEKPLIYHELSIVTVEDLICNQIAMDVPLKFEITKVNGVDNTSSVNKKSAAIRCYESAKAFPWVHLIEEGTGTWCGWCPLGIVMMEYVEENYPDLFARVAIHSNDAMAVSSASAWLNKYGKSFPCGRLDRGIAITSLGYGNLERMQNEMDGYAAAYQGVPATIGFKGLEAAIDENGEMTVDSKVGVTFDTKNNNRYRLSYYITQDGMGPYNQSNNYAGGAYGDMGGWGKLGKSVKTEYNEVCRLLYGGVNGVSQSMPDDMVAGEEYSCSNVLNIADIKAEKFNLITFIVDSFTGNVVNAKVIEVENTYLAGVNEAAIDSRVVAKKFYTIDGVEVNEPSNGIYIVRSIYSDGTVKTVKTVVK